MDFERLKMPLQQYKRLFETLKTQGLSETQIDSILNREFSTFEQGKN